MPHVTAYLRPTTIDDALELLVARTAVPLAGGTSLNATLDQAARVVVDLQALGLDGVEGTDPVRLGAMVRLDRLCTAPVPPLVGSLARAELPSTLRAMATVAGTVVAGGGESVLLAGLIACDAVAELSDGTSLPVEVLAADPAVIGRRLILSVVLPASGAMAWAATGRTPADTPIVAVVGRRDSEGSRLVATGVGRSPVVLDPARPTDGLAPPADFRGSAEFRRHLVEVLSRRVVEELGGGS